MSTESLKYYEEECIKQGVQQEYVPILSKILYQQNTMHILKQGGIVSEPTEITICDELAGKGVYKIKDLKIMEMKVSNTYQGCPLCLRSANRINREGHGKSYNRECPNAKKGEDVWKTEIVVNEFVLEDENNNRIKLLIFDDDDLACSTKYGAELMHGNNMDIIAYYNGAKDEGGNPKTDDDGFVIVNLNKIEVVSDPNEDNGETKEVNVEELAGQIKQAIGMMKGGVDVKTYEMYVDSVGSTRKEMDKFFNIKGDKVTNKGE
jgi:hypothetical protein